MIKVTLTKEEHFVQTITYEGYGPRALGRQVKVHAPGWSDELFVLHEDIEGLNGWVITEAETGYGLFPAKPTIKVALAKMRQVVNERGYQDFKSRIEDAKKEAKEILEKEIAK